MTTLSVEANSRVCLECGDSIYHLHVNKKWCSDLCKTNYLKKDKKPLVCAHCGNEFISRNGRGTFCSSKCKREAKTLKQSTFSRSCKECGVSISHLHFNEKWCSDKCRATSRAKERSDSTKARLGEDALSCKICKYTIGKNLIPHLNNVHGISGEDYKRLYPGVQLFADSTIKKLSENASGEKNVWYNHGGKLSPFSKNFVSYENMTEEERDTSIQGVIKKANENCIKANSLEYFLNKGYDEETARAMLKERQTTFSLEKCIAKYGEEAGHQRWLDRQEQWHRNYKKTNYSKISQELFRAISAEFPEECIFAEYQGTDKNREFVFRTKKGSVYKLDFYVPSKGKIIEFDGTYWHDDRQLSDSINKTRDQHRDEEILASGQQLEILHVKEHDYKQNKQEVIQKCLLFLKS